MFKEFIKKIKKYKRIGVVSHIRPDGDCIGSQVGLSIWLEKNGFEVDAFNDDDVPVNLEWLTEYFPIQSLDIEKIKKCDLIILVDGNALHRFSHIESWTKELDVPFWMIDHHPDPNDEFDLQVSVPGASSTCELIYNLYNESNIEQLEKSAAMALYTGIITDTGSLQFDSVTPKTLEAVADILRRGDFKPNVVAEQVFSTKTESQYKLLSLALGTIQLYESNQIATMYVTQEMLEETQTTNSDTEGFVNYPLSIAGVKAAVLLKDLAEEGVKMSLRSRSNVDVNVWARELDGGGHQKAAGAWHPGPLEKTIEDVISIGKKQLNQIETT
ncbi:DHH family phosphoesterase [Rhodohalobacter barkolensis]|uniref:Bifunctional oligoribonuclease/PAP phosphatase NrnA n=1 Tax=Rhodohalobacter barkolensis TaxID=2053187 RepID=A0A2N0VHZ3_9BACT|nr:bifunctional oligoribonuclease/PAP phosphatase NrnA [Rhodohalobacter barkolensis]PKD43813.1 bifunctional oligoribonuclease/PAP phosphatase NrnA [Rhodohalobacter barkolensis]